jgi:hypothetical protein
MLPEPGVGGRCLKVISDDAIRPRPALRRPADPRGQDRTRGVRRQSTQPTK